MIYQARWAAKKIPFRGQAVNNSWKEYNGIANSFDRGRLPVNNFNKLYSATAIISSKNRTIPLKVTECLSLCSCVSVCLYQRISLNAVPIGCNGAFHTSKIENGRR